MSSALSQVGGTLKRVKKSLGRIFKKSSKRSSKLKNHTFMLLDLRPGAGNMLGAYWEYDPPWLGSFGTLNTSECPKDAVECSLWQILQATAPSRYSLSQTACLGILRRAECRGKSLPPLLEAALRKEITSAGHLSARNFSFGDEIIESDGKLNFYVQTEFDVDAAFGTFVLTDENDDWLNVYANYDIAQGKSCDTLELTLCKGDGSEESWSYPLSAAEQDVLLRKMEEYCQQQTGMSLHDYAQQFREEPEQRQGPVMKL